MKEVLFIKDSLGNKVTYFLLMAFLVALPFDRFYSELVLIGLLLHTIIHLRKDDLLSIRPIQLLPASLYLLMIVCTVYSADKEQTFKDWEKQLAILLFPLIFSMSPIDMEKYKMPLLKAFGITCVIIVLYLFYDALKTIRFNNLPISSLIGTQFNNHNFSLPIDLHATYFSMYIGLSIVTFLCSFNVSTKKTQRVFYAFCCMVLFAGLLQLSSRAALIAVLVIINIIVPFFLLKDVARRRYLIVACTFSLILAGLLTMIGPLKSRFVTDLKKDLSVDNSVLTEPRAERWHCALELIARSPLYGYGSGSEVKVLKEKYFDERLYDSYLHELNAHNEYLSFAIKYGIIGLALYAYLLFWAFKTAIKKKDIFFLSFLVLVAIVSFSENILDVNKGIFFFSFFFSMFTQCPVSERKPYAVRVLRAA